MGTQYVDPMQAAACDEAADILDGRTTVDDVQQQVYDGPAIPVRQADPVATQQLPALSGQDAQFPVTNQLAVKILNEDPKRARAQIIAATGAILIGVDQAAVQNGRGFRLPVAQLFELRNGAKWFARADTTDAVVYVVTEQWTR